jgi:hypothetical protein
MLNSNGEHVTRDGFYVAMYSCWNPADPDSMYYDEDYVRGDEALSILNYNIYIEELNRRKANGEKL